MRILRFLSAVLILFLLSVSSWSQQDKSTRIQYIVDSLRTAGNFPALYVHIINDEKEYAAISGFADKENNRLAKPGDRLMLGSVGKTFVSAIALKLVSIGKLDLEAHVSEYLGHYKWYQRIPNAEHIRVRNLMNHTSGIMRYEFNPQFLKDLRADPDKEWTPEELLHYIFDQSPAFKAGQGWEYSDTNYILLGMILEFITGEKYYDLFRNKLTGPLGLAHILPSDKRKLPGLVQGYAGEGNEFTGKDRVINDDGTFIINPQFEWTGGGLYGTTADLAKWGKLLYEEKVVDTGYLMNYALPAKLGPNTKYAQGVIIKETIFGQASGHSGFFPGYMTELYYFPQYKMSIAVQTNTSDFKNLKLNLHRVLMEAAKEVLRP